VLPWLAIGFMVVITTGYAQTAPATSYGGIEGVVLDEKGNPLPKATVFVGTISPKDRRCIDALFVNEPH
jgi:hypothetical protein